MTTEDVNQENQEPKNQGLSLNDIHAMVQIVDLASSRGAFRADELSKVGAVYDKVNSFLISISAQQNASEEATETDNPQDTNNG